MIFSRRAVCPGMSQFRGWQNENREHRHRRSPATRRRRAQPPQEFWTPRQNCSRPVASTSLSTTSRGTRRSASAPSTRRFTCKQELVDGVFQQHMDDLADSASAALEYEDPWEGLVEFVALTASKWRSTGHGRRLLHRRRGPGTDRLRARAGDAGGRRPDRPGPATPVRCDRRHRQRSLRGQPDGRVRHRLRPDRSRPEAWRRYLALVLDGLRAEGAERTPLPRTAAD